MDTNTAQTTAVPQGFGLGMSSFPTSPFLRFFAAEADKGGGSDDGSDKPADDARTNDDAGAGDSTGDVAPNSDDKSKGSDDAGSVEQLPGWAQKLIRDARAEAGKARTDAKQAAADEARTEVLDQIAAAVGLKKDDDQQLTPEQLTEQLVEAERNANKDLKRELIVLRHAAALGANGDRLLDSRSFLSKLAAVDPSSEKAADDIKAAIKSVLDADRTFALQQAAGSSGSSSHSGGDTTNRSKNMREAAARRLGITT